MSEIELGDTVKCKLTGFIGVAASRTEFINGCVQYDVIPKVGKDNKVPEGVSIDEVSLEVVKTTKKKKIVKKETGGAMTIKKVMKGY